MKRFSQLTAAQQELAELESLRRIVIAITKGGLRFNDVANGNDLQARIDAAREESATPEALGDLIVARCRRELLALARLSARDAIYVEGDTVIALDEI